jgi:hypothetical protein
MSKLLSEEMAAFIVVKSSCRLKRDNSTRFSSSHPKIFSNIAIPIADFYSCSNILGSPKLYSKIFKVTYAAVA